MKKTVSMLVTAALIIALAGCNGDQTSGNPGGSTPNPVSAGGGSTGNSENKDSPGSTGISDKDDTPGSSVNSDSAPESSDSASESTGGEVSSPESSSDEKPPVDHNDKGGEMSGSVFVLDDGRALELYGGGYERGRNYAETLNQFKQLVGDQVNVFSLVAPKAEAFYLPEKYSGWSASEWDNIEYLNGFFDGIIPVDAYTALAQHVDEDIYFRTDHHWQPLGAYYAAEEFAKTAQVPFAPLSDYETIAMEGYVGTMYGYSDEDPRVKNNPDVFTYYKPKNDYTTTYYTQSLTNPYEAGLFLKSLENIPVVSWYLVFMGGDDEVTHVHTDVTNGRKLVIVKDSYGNAVVPCLTNSFEDIWVVDMRYFEGSISQLVRDEGLTDVLFCMCSFSATGDNQYKLADRL